MLVNDEVVVVTVMSRLAPRRAFEMIADGWNRC